MVTLSKEQQRIVEANLGLVHKVIADKVHGPYQMGIYTREDLYQIGCIGLCKAAATDKGGNFSTYAYRLIWNQICDALIYSTRHQAKECVCEIKPYMLGASDELPVTSGLAEALEKAKAFAPPSTVKGIEALKLLADGYTCREIGERMGGASDKLVCAWISKARKFLKEREEIACYAGT